MAHLKDDPACDARIKEFKATVRCIPLVDDLRRPRQVHRDRRDGGPPRGDREGLLTHVR